MIVALAKKLPYDTSLYEKKNDRYIGQVDRLGNALSDLQTAELVVPTLGHQTFPGSTRSFQN